MKSRLVHVELDRWLSRITRRIGWRPGTRLVIELLRRRYARRYACAANPWVLIDDFDGDLRLRLDRSGFIGSLIYWRGFHSVGELRLVKHLLAKDMVFVDVGANQGEFTLCAAKRLPEGKVVAFEPVRILYDQLLENIRLNDFSNVSAFAQALSDVSGTGTIFVPTEIQADFTSNDGTASLYRRDDRPTRAEVVRLDRLDHVLEKAGLNRVDVIKIDAEGAELSVLRGAVKTLARSKPVLVMELNDLAFRAAGYTSSDLLKFLEQFGYRASLIREDGQTVETAEHKLPSFCNVMCCRR